ncbi:hypothetical protein PAPHI01_1340 [Pancytospora philotis]|nr:hypothetical protein PAPHI01_1340 [Pancytospora philotis]
MILSKKLSWMLAEAEDSLPGAPKGTLLVGLRYVYVQDVIDMQTRRFFVSDGRHFVACGITSEAFTLCMRDYDPNSICFKGSILTLMKYRFVRSVRGAVELLVEEVWYTGEGSLAGDALDLNDALNRKRSEKGTDVAAGVRELLNGQNKHDEAGAADTMQIDEGARYSINFMDVKRIVDPRLYAYLVREFKESHDREGNAEIDASDSEAWDMFGPFKNRLVDKFKHLLCKSGGEEREAGQNPLENVAEMETACHPSTLNADDVAAVEMKTQTLKEIPLSQALNTSQSSSKLTCSISLDSISLWSSMENKENVDGTQSCPAPPPAGSYEHTIDWDLPFINAIGAPFTCTYPASGCPKDEQELPSTGDSNIDASGTPIKSMAHSTDSSDGSVPTGTKKLKCAIVLRRNQSRNTTRAKRRVVIALPRNRNRRVRRVFITGAHYMLSIDNALPDGSPCSGSKNRIALRRNTMSMPRQFAPVRGIRPNRPRLISLFNTDKPEPALLTSPVKSNVHSNSGPIRTLIRKPDLSHRTAGINLFDKYNEHFLTTDDPQAHATVSFVRLGGAGTAARPARRRKMILESSSSSEPAKIAHSASMHLNFVEQDMKHRISRGARFLASNSMLFEV